MILQVAYSIQGAEARERELRGLPETARHLRADRVIVVTFNDEETLDVAGTCVQVVPAWRWRLKTMRRRCDATCVGRFSWSSG